MFGEDITTAAREAAAKRKPKADAEGEATPEGPVAETAADKDGEVLANEDAAVSEEPLEAEAEEP